MKTLPIAAIAFLLGSCLLPGKAVALSITSTVTAAEFPPTPIAAQDLQNGDFTILIQLLSS